jgi:AcrR family transcriptional regulator
MKQVRRSYDGSSRRNSAQQTRLAILGAAKRLFIERGYAATSMQAIAQAAGVALDTVYASVGKKPAVFRLLIELALSGGDVPVPAMERKYVKEIASEPDARRKLDLYAAAICAILPRLAPLARVLREAAGQDEELLAVWTEISNRRAANMRVFARELHSTGALRADLSLDAVADIIWSMNGPEYYQLLVEQRRWSLECYERWLAHAWARLILQDHSESRV